MLRRFCNSSLRVRLKFYIKILIRLFSPNRKNFPSVVFIYVMRKVSSTSLYESITKQSKALFFQIHDSPRGLGLNEMFMYIFRKKSFFYRELELERKFPRTYRTPINLSIGLFTEAMILRTFKKRGIPLKIISILREPVSRDISDFFQRFKVYTGVNYNDSSFTDEELLDLFLKNAYHELPSVWFDDNIKKYFGIDVYDKPFPKRGYETFKNGKIELLLYKCEIEDTLKEKIIEDFMGIKNFKLKRYNQTSKKSFGNAYKKLKSLPLPESYLEKMLT